MTASHVNCRRAVRSGEGTLTWHCIGCGREIGHYLGHPARSGDWDGIRLVPGFVPLGERDGLPAFGPPDRVRIGGQDARATLRPDVLAPRPPIHVYCLNRQCGIGQHLH
jgi:hypothetical protein